MSRGILTVLVVALVAGAAFATPIVTYTLTPVNEYTANDGNLTPLATGAVATAAAIAAGSAGMYEIQVAYTITDTGAQEITYGATNPTGMVTFANLSAGIATTGTLAYADQSQSGNTDLAYAYTGNPYWTTGSSSTRLGATGANGVQGTGVDEAIFFASSTNKFATNMESNANPMGDVFVMWDGTTYSTLSAAPGTSGNGGVNTGALAGYVKEASGPDGVEAWAGNAFTTNSNTVQFGTNVPEPATMSLLIIGGIGALLRRRTA